MVELETVEELAESIADLAGVRNPHARMWFVKSIQKRIQQAVKNDIFLENNNKMKKVWRRRRLENYRRIKGDKNIYGKLYQMFEM